MALKRMMRALRVDLESPPPPEPDYMAATLDILLGSDKTHEYYCQGPQPLITGRRFTVQTNPGMELKNCFLGSIITRDITTHTLCATDFLLAVSTDDMRLLAVSKPPGPRSDRDRQLQHGGWSADLHHCHYDPASGSFHLEPRISLPPHSPSAPLMGIIHYTKDLSLQSFRDLTSPKDFIVGDSPTLDHEQAVGPSRQLQDIFWPEIRKLASNSSADDIRCLRALCHDRVRENISICGLPMQGPELDTARHESFTLKWIGSNDKYYPTRADELCQQSEATTEDGAGRRHPMNYHAEMSKWEAAPTGALLTLTGFGEDVPTNNIIMPLASICSSPQNAISSFLLVKNLTANELWVIFDYESCDQDSGDVVPPQDRAGSFIDGNSISYARLSPFDPKNGYFQLVQLWSLGFSVQTPFRNPVTGELVSDSQPDFRYFELSEGAESSGI